MNAVRNDKQEWILDVAIRRFSHFGIHKTTMTEIAEDLGMSKQALSYYFSDKQGLIKAIEEKITEEYLDELKKSLDGAGMVKEALVELVNVKRNFLEKYYMLIAQAHSGEILGDRNMAASKKEVQQKEAGLLALLFERGVQTKELKPLDARATGSLLLDTLSAFAYCLKDRGMVPDAELFQQLSRKQQEVMLIFYNGLKA